MLGFSYFRSCSDAELKFDLMLDTGSTVPADANQIEDDAENVEPDSGPQDSGNARIDTGVLVDAGTATVAMDAGTSTVVMDAGLLPDAQPLDTGLVIDAGLVPDAGPIDTGIHPDAEPADTGLNAGAEPVDTGLHADAEPTDAGIWPDAEPPDTEFGQMPHNQTRASLRMRCPQFGCSRHSQSFPNQPDG